MHGSFYFSQFYREVINMHQCTSLRSKRDDLICLYAEMMATVMVGLAALVFKSPRVSEAMQYLSLSDLPLSMMPSRPIHAVTVYMFSCGQHATADQWLLK